MPSIEDIRAALSIADKASQKYGLSISCGVPIPPCVIDRELYKNIRFGDCPVDTRRAYPTVDPMGNVRPCNHSATILGNLFESDMGSILSNNISKSYTNLLPDECVDCKHLKTCRGGCRAASEVCGSVCGIDPFVIMMKGDVQCTV